MRAGYRPDGTVIGVYRSEKYRLFKMQLNPIAQGRMDWMLTGETSENLYVESLGGGRFTIKSRVSRWNELISRFSANDMGAINREVFRGLQQTRYATQLNRRLKSITGIN